MQLDTMPGTFAVCLLNEFPDAQTLSSLAEPFFLSATGQEISLVCPSDVVPRQVAACHGGWAMLRVAGPLDFDQVGILAALTTTLASEDIPVFVVSTYLTDYLLVPGDRLADAEDALTAAGHTIG